MKNKKVMAKTNCMFKISRKLKIPSKSLNKIQLKRGKYGAFFENRNTAQNFQNARFFNFDFFHNFKWCLAKIPSEKKFKIFFP